jgi:Domain of unknown function (DUF4279)
MPVVNRRLLSELSGGHPKDRRRVWYELRGESLDPTEITGRVGISPDRAWRADDLKPRTGKPYGEGAWMIDSGLEDDDEVHDHLDALLARMRPDWATFVDLGRRFDASVGAVIELAEAQGPLVAVLPDVSAAVAELNATIVLDLYSAPEAETKATA